MDAPNIGGNCTVYLDGVRMYMVRMFNVADGWVECYVTSPSKYSNMDCGHGDWISSRLYGFVELDVKQ